MLASSSFIVALEYELPPSTIKSKVTDSYFVTEVEINSTMRANSNLAEILNSSLGISLNNLGTCNQFSTVSIRGSKSSGILIMLDGVPINLLNESVDISTISLKNIKKVVIYSGSTSSKFGYNAFGGAINLISNNQKEEQLAYLKYGSFQTFEQGLNVNLDPLKSNVYFNHLYSKGDFSFPNNHGTPDNPLNNTIDIRKNNEVDQYYFGYKANQFFSDLNTLYFAYFQAKKGMPGTIYNPSNFAYQTENKSFFNFKTQNLNLFQNHSFNFDLNYQIAENDFFDPKNEFAPIAQNTYYSINAFRGFLEDTILFNDFTLKAKVNTARETLGKNIYFPNVNIQKHTTFPSRNLLDFNLEANVFSLNPNIIFNLDYANYINENDFLTSSLGTIYEFNPNLQLKAHVGNGYRMPSYSEKYISWGPYYSNPNLKPENSFEAEIGIKNITNNLVLGGNLFKRWVSNLIEINLMSGFMIKPINVGQAEILGFELYLEYYLERLKFKTNFTILNGVDTTSGSSYGYPIIGQPLTLFNAIANYQILEQADVFLEYVYRGNHYTTVGSLFKLPDQHTFNLGSKYTISNSFKLILNLNNILNSYYYDNYGFPLPGFNITGSLLWVL
ncbi:MAG: TonB-dependent receptor [Candidatus Margulisiibacteriota bacterium]|jgi:outer membrane cobalamin receptor